MVGLPPALVPRPIRRAAPHSAHGRLPGGPQHAAARGRSGRHRAPGDRRALPCPLSGNARARLRDDDADGLRVRLPRAARSGRDHARELGTRDQGAAGRPAGLHRGGASRQGRDAGPEPARPAAAGHGAQRPCRGAAALRQGHARLRHGRVDPPCQSRSRPERRAGLERAPDLGWRSVQHVPRRHTVGVAPAVRSRGTADARSPGRSVVPGRSAGSTAGGHRGAIAAANRRAASFGTRRGADRDREGHARNRRRPVSRQADRRRRAAGGSRHLHRRPRPAERFGPLPGQGRGYLAGTADGVRRQRSLGRHHPAHAEHALPLHRARLARPVRLVAARARQEARRRAADHAGARRRLGLGRPRREVGQR